MRSVLQFVLFVSLLEAVGGWGFGSTCVGSFCPKAPKLPHNPVQSTVGRLASAAGHIPGLPKNLKCDPKKLKGEPLFNGRLPLGDHCCNPLLYNVMNAAFSWVKYRPDFLQAGAKKLAFAARLLIRLIQSKIGKSFEVIISEKEFVTKNNHHGNFTCKFGVDGFHVLAYATPKQYNVRDSKKEEKFANLDAREPLGISGNNPQLKAFLDLALRLIPVAK